ncbi:MAG: hypothetical protein U0271_02970 [Polyangiaceae bacterium]
MALPLTRYLGAALAFLFGVSVASATFADEPDPQTKAQAEALFQEGGRLLDAGDVEHACPKLEAAVELTRGEALGGKLLLASCYEKAGRTASAWGLYTEVAGRAEGTGATDRAKEAREHADALAIRLHKLELAVDSALVALEGLSIELGGKPLGRAQWSTPLPVDPGRLHLRVSAPGRVAYEQDIDIPATAGSTHIQISKLAAAPGAPTPVKDEPQPAKPFFNEWRIAGLGFGVGGVLAMAASAGIMAAAKSDYDDAYAQNGCAGSPPVCRETGALEDARALGDIGSGVFFGGVGLLALGVVVFATAGLDDPKSTAVTAVRIAASPSKLELGVTFQ